MISITSVEKLFLSSTKVYNLYMPCLVQIVFWWFLFFFLFSYLLVQGNGKVNITSVEKLFFLAQKCIIHTCLSLFRLSSGGSHSSYSSHICQSKKMERLALHQLKNFFFLAQKCIIHTNTCLALFRLSLVFHFSDSSQSCHICQSCSMEEMGVKVLHSPLRKTNQKLIILRIY